MSLQDLDKIVFTWTKHDIVFTWTIEGILIFLGAVLYIILVVYFDKFFQAKRDENAHDEHEDNAI